MIVNHKVAIDKEVKSRGICTSLRQSPAQGLTAHDIGTILGCQEHGSHRGFGIREDKMNAVDIGTSSVCRRKIIRIRVVVVITIIHPLIGSGGKRSPAHGCIIRSVLMNCDD